MIRFKPLLAFALLGIAGCGTDGGFDEVTQPNKTVVQGRALTAEGAPAPGVWVHLFAEGLLVQRTASETDGAFRLESDVVGRIMLVLNDGHGRGALREMNAYGEGINEAGEIFMEPLEEVSRIVDLHGVGFEERLTRDGGNYLYPVYNADATAVFVMRKKSGDRTYEVVRVSIPDGNETVLASDEQIDSNLREPIQLIGNHAVTYSTTRPIPNEPDMLAWNTVVRDATTGNEIWADRMDHYFSWSTVQVGDDLVLFERTEERFIDSPYDSSYVYRITPVLLDTHTGATRRGPMLSGWMNQFNFIDHKSGAIYFASFAFCGDPSAPECSGFDDPVDLYRLDLATLTSVKVTSFDADTALALSPSGKVIHHRMITASGQQTYLIGERDLSSGADRTLVVLDVEVDGSLQKLSFNADGSQIALELRTRDPQTQDWTERTLARLDVVSATLTQLPLTHTIDGVSVTFCDGDYPKCAASFSPSGDFRVTDYVHQGSRRLSVTIDIEQNGNTTGHLVEVAEADAHPARMASPDGAFEISLLRDLITGFMQLRFGAAASSPTMQSQLTFITAQHHHPAFKSDGSELYYFTRDPVSGFEQLFRVVLE